jgi:hypothetical protein
MYFTPIRFWLPGTTFFHMAFSCYIIRNTLLFSAPYDYLDRPDFNVQFSEIVVSVYDDVPLERRFGRSMQPTALFRSIPSTVTCARSLLPSPPLTHSNEMADSVCTLPLGELPQDYAAQVPEMILEDRKIGHH